MSGDAHHGYNDGGHGYPRYDSGQPQAGPGGQPGSGYGQPPHGSGGGQPGTGHGLPPWGGPAPTPGYQPAPSPKGFFGALFDFSFSNFVTLSFAKVIYALAIGVIGLIWVVMILGTFADSPGMGLLVLLLGWIPALFYVVLVRVGLEFSVAMVRTAQNTSELAQRR